MTLWLHPVVIVTILQQQNSIKERAHGLAIKTWSHSSPYDMHNDELDGVCCEYFRFIEMYCTKQRLFVLIEIILPYNPYLYLVDIYSGEPFVFIALSAGIL